VHDARSEVVLTIMVKGAAKAKGKIGAIFSCSS
jgi:hypothetical protein